jgi:hypothetical protein
MVSTRCLRTLLAAIVVLKLSPEESASKCTTLGVAAAVMIVLGYPGELIVEDALGTRWMYGALAMLPFLYGVYEWLVGLVAATNNETNDGVTGLVKQGADLHNLQLVDLPSCVYLSNDWYWWRAGRGCNPGWLLRVGHHLEVWRWPYHLPHC